MKVKNRNKYTRYSLDLSREEEPLFKEVTDPTTGNLKEVPDGKKNVQLEIDKASNGLTLTEILQKQALAGETVSLGASESQYGDASKVENDLIEIDKQQKKALESFNKLPDDFRAMFNNSPAQFLQTISDEVINNYVKKKFPKVDEKEEVK